MLTTEWLRRFSLTLNPFDSVDAASETELQSYLVAHRAITHALNGHQSSQATAYVAPRGCGKTATRQAFEMACAESDEQILVVSLLEDTWRRLFDRRAEPGFRGATPHLEALARGLLITLARPNNLARLQRLDTCAESARYLSRLAQQHPLPSQQRKGLLKHLAAVDSLTEPADDDLAAGDPLDQLLVLGQIVADLGFTRWYIVIDGVENAARDSAAAAELLRPIVDLRPPHPTIPVKYFICPETIESLRRAAAWPDTIEVNEILWSEHDLEQLIERRLSHFSDRRVTSLDYFCVEGISVDLTRQLIQIAEQSPRQLLQQIKLLFNERALDATDDSLKIGDEQVARAIAALERAKRSNNQQLQAQARATTVAASSYVSGSDLLNQEERHGLAELLLVVVDRAGGDIRVLTGSLPLALRERAQSGKTTRQQIMVLLDSINQAEITAVPKEHPLLLVIAEARFYMRGLKLADDLDTAYNLATERLRPPADN